VPQSDGLAPGAGSMSTLDGVVEAASPLRSRVVAWWYDSAN
jgi:hypothetical protein